MPKIPNTKPTHHSNLQPHAKGLTHLQSDLQCLSMYICTVSTFLMHFPSPSFS